MKITAVITDADIRWHIDQAATELEEDNQIRFPDSTALCQLRNRQLRTVRTRPLRLPSGLPGHGPRHG